MTASLALKCMISVDFCMVSLGIERFFFYLNRKKPFQIVHPVLAPNASNFENQRKDENDVNFWSTMYLFIHVIMILFQSCRSFLVFFTRFKAGSYDFVVKWIDVGFFFKTILFFIVKLGLKSTLFLDTWLLLFLYFRSDL